MSRLRIIFVGYWSINDALTKATINPWLHLMQASEKVEKVILCTIEREHIQVPSTDFGPRLPKITHFPLISESKKSITLTKISDFTLFPRKISEIALQENADVVFAHGAPAGALAYKVWKSTGLPFYVSLFEPHADYMAESGVWNRAGLKYIFQKYWEKQVIKRAAGLMPVAENYLRVLENKGVDQAKVKVVPCVVQLDDFKFNPESRAILRERLGWQESIVGIYVGKYGGLYYLEEAFGIYKKCFELIPNFKLIILSPQPTPEINDMLRAANMDETCTYLKQATHEEVALCLSAADFAFATYKPGASKKYLSPVKIGEYWANGLPVLLTEGIGDESDIISLEGGGATFNLQQEGSLEQAIQKVLSIIQEPNHRKEIPQLARKYRSPDKLREAFDHFFGKEGRL